jgi:hypothetical protein
MISIELSNFRHSKTETHRIRGAFYHVIKLGYLRGQRMKKKKF